MVALAGCVGPAAVSVSTPRPDGVPADVAVSPDVAPTSAHAVAEVAVAPATAGATADAASPSVSPPTLGEWRSGNGVAGFDVSRYQPQVDWTGLVRSGHTFVYVKATEGTNHRSPTHDEQRTGARAAGLVQGAYHYARPGQSSGTLQARFFHANGGAWAADGLTMPGALDLEYAETGDPCHGLEPRAMRAWVREFSDEYRRLSGRIPTIYTKAEVWDTCTGGDPSFGDHPLWLFDHAVTPGALPSGWDRPVLWQRAVEHDLDRNVFFGTTDQLVAWASAPLR